MRKTWAIVILSLMVVVLIIGVGCQKRQSTKEEAYKNFQKKITNISSYKCKADIEVIGNKESQKYSLIHEYTDENHFKLKVLQPEHIKGKTIEYKGNKIIVTNPNVNDKVVMDNVGEDSQHLFIGDFIKNYMQGEDIKIDLKNGSLKLTTSIPGNTKYFYKQILYINSKKNYPTKLEILDQEGNRRFEVNYSNFEYK